MKTLFFTSSGITITLDGVSNSTSGSWALKIEFVHANKVKPTGLDPKETVFSYFKGKPEDWKTGLSTFGLLIYKDLWPGIDLLYSGTVDQLKYEYVIRPGAEPGQIRMAYHGATDVSITESGSLSISNPVEAIENDRPFTYQMIEGVKNEIPLSFKLESHNDNDVTVCSFDISDYDPDLPLIIDPSMLVYCGYIGGDRDEGGCGITVDSAGCAYITEYTQSKETTFPVTVGPCLTFHPNNNSFPDAYVAKLNAEGSALVYCGYIGGR